MNASLPMTWLTSETSLEQLESECESLDIPQQAKAVMLKAAQILSAKMQVGDELWRYRTPAESWCDSVGSSGLAVRRNNEVVAHQEVAMN
jgi:hypothetical protein